MQNSNNLKEISFFHASFGLIIRERAYLNNDADARSAAESLLKPYMTNGDKIVLWPGSGGINYSIVDEENRVENHNVFIK